MSTTLQNAKFGELCNSIIGISTNIQSVAVINKFGKAIEKISKPTFTKKFPDYLNEFFCMHSVLQTSMGRDFDENYGPVNYHVTERAVLTTISFPLNDNVILVTTNKDTFTMSLAKKIFETIEAVAWY